MSVDEAQAVVAAHLLDGVAGGGVQPGSPYAGALVWSLRAAVAGLEFDADDGAAHAAVSYRHSCCMA